MQSKGPGSCRQRMPSAGLPGLVPKPLLHLPPDAPSSTRASLTCCAKVLPHVTHPARTALSFPRENLRLGQGLRARLEPRPALCSWGLPSLQVRQQGAVPAPNTPRDPFPHGLHLPGTIRRGRDHGILGGSLGEGLTLGMGSLLPIPYLGPACHWDLLGLLGSFLRQR